MLLHYLDQMSMLVSSFRKLALPFYMKRGWCFLPFLRSMLSVPVEHHPSQRCLVSICLGWHGQKLLPSLAPQTAVYFEWPEDKLLGATGF